jgi:GNAT superfamily N-acetyltransferase
MSGQNTDPHSLALKMHRLHHWLDASELPDTTTRHVINPNAAVIVDPTSNSPAAALNRNAIRLTGASGLSVADLLGMARLFEVAGIDRHFVWLSPGPDADVVREWLKTRGAVKVPWTRYPTLLHAAPAPEPRVSALLVREISRREIDAAGIGTGTGTGHAAILDGYLQSLGRPGFQHFAAYAQNQIIATAALAHFEDMAYLTYACTAESYRRRGAQTALIAARIAAAKRLGCQLIASQTLTMLEDSFANLQRAGFVEVYEREVFECSAYAQHHS